MDALSWIPPDTRFRSTWLFITESQFKVGTHHIRVIAQLNAVNSDRTAALASPAIYRTTATRVESISNCLIFQVTSEPHNF